MAIQRKIDFHVVNGAISLGSLRILAVTSSSLVLVGDAQSIVCTAQFDTLPTATIPQPIVPLTQ